jgi:uncharacterized glyoxalase superfamily protein PhnB
MTTKPIPDGYSTVTPYLSISSAKDAIEFYKLAFGATEVLRLNTPTGEIAHADPNRQLTNNAIRTLRRQPNAQPRHSGRIDICCASLCGRCRCNV